jgi:hypothetical protein
MLAVRGLYLLRRGGKCRKDHMVKRKGFLPVTTITYSDSINKLKALFGLTDESTNHLIELGNLRNKVTHFGIQKESEFYEVIGIITFAFDFIKVKKIQDHRKKVGEINLKGPLEPSQWQPQIMTRCAANHST